MSTMDKKTKQIVIYAIGAVVFVGVIFWGFVGKNSESDSQGFSSSVLAATENSFDFGTISISGGNVSHEFVVINDGTNPVVVEKVYTTCGCTTAILTDASNKEYGPFGMQGHGTSPDTRAEIGPGESLTVRAIFDPAAHGPSGVGLAQRSVYIETNSAKSPKLEFSFQASVTP